jgi:hypothetical protein
VDNSQQQSNEGTPQPQNQGEQADHGRSGEGAASAMQQLISQSRQHRHQTGEADDAAGGHGQ